MTFPLSLAAVSIGLLTLLPAQDLPRVPRVIPPVGQKIAAADRTALQAELERLTTAFQALPVRPENANAEVFLKAVRYALDQDEFYDARDAGRAKELLKEAEERIAALKSGKKPWLNATGLVVRGYYSRIDGSPQPFGLDIPDDAPATGAPAWMWLHGRGDTATDLQFIAGRMHGKSQFRPAGTVIVHPFGRYCLGFKSAGEQDVLDVQALLVKEKRIDPRRTALAGFSMGGAGAWLLGAHYTDRWAVVHTGAGFVDVRQYRGLSEADVAALPPWEVTLWGLNDVPDYVRNLLNVPLVSYSGEIDKQRASAEIMAGCLQKEGLTLTHLIGPGMGHKYHPDTGREVEALVQKSLLNPPAGPPEKLTFQTRTLKYARLHWLEVTGLEQHWKEARVDAAFNAPVATAERLEMTTANVTSLRLLPPDGVPFRAGLTVRIDAQELRPGGAGKAILLTRTNGQWSAGPPAAAPALRKIPGLQGPVDDAFTGPFLYVLPDKPCASPAMERWVKSESASEQSRWRHLMRGDLRAKPASAVTAEDIQRYHLILWGDAAANSLIARVLPDLPVKWSADTLTLGGTSVPAAGHVPCLIYPNPLNPARYVVLNSGLTFREAHSKTNSLQNPHLPDWAVIDLSSPPDDEKPGRIVSAGFFDETWK